MKQLYTFREAADALGISQTTLGKMTRYETDPLPVYRLDDQTHTKRIRKGELEQWLDRHLTRIN